MPPSPPTLHFAGAAPPRPWPSGAPRAAARHLRHRPHPLLQAAQLGIQGRRPPDLGGFRRVLWPSPFTPPCHVVVAQQQSSRCCLDGCLAAVARGSFLPPPADLGGGFPPRHRWPPPTAPHPPLSAARGSGLGARGSRRGPLLGAAGERWWPSVRLAAASSSSDCSLQVMAVQLGATKGAQGENHARHAVGALDGGVRGRRSPPWRHRLSS